MTRGTARRPAACLATSLLALAACSCNPSDPRPAEPVETEATTPAVVVATEGEVMQLLGRRARALAADRRTAFLATSAPGPDRQHQLTWFDTLSDLPVAAAAYEVSSIGELAGTDRTRVAAQLLVRLEGFDKAPVAANHVLELAGGDEGWRVVSDRQSSSQVIAAPWQLPEARIRSADGVVVVLDRDSAPHGDRLLRLAQQAQAETRAHVRYPWRQGVVVLAPSTDATLRDEGLDAVEIARLGGIASPVEDGEGDYVTSRVVINPAVLRFRDPVMLTLLRHEFAHVTLGARAWGLPKWLIEGIAEWASRRGDPGSRLATSVVRQADRGITEMPLDVEFFDEDGATAYGVAWYAVEWLEQEFGPRAPYYLLEAAARFRGSRGDEVSQLLERRYGVTADELARRAGELVVETYG